MQKKSKSTTLITLFLLFSFFFYIYEQDTSLTNDNHLTFIFYSIQFNSKKNFFLIIIINFNYHSLTKHLKPTSMISFLFFPINCIPPL